jgi:hypothetical protein
MSLYCYSNEFPNQLIVNYAEIEPHVMVILKFIYSLAAFPNESEGFISTSEDRTVRIWKGKYGTQITKVSVWVS